MLQELFNLVRNTAGETVVNNQAIPNEQNAEVIAEATNTVASGLRNMVAGGGVQNLVSLFENNQGKQGLLTNPLVNMMMGHFSNKLINKFGVGPNHANNVASGLIPSILENLINKTNDPNDSKFSLDNLLNSITGGQAAQTQNSGGGLGGLLGQLAGGQGGGGLMDIVTQMAQGAQNQQQRNGGSLLDLIKGFAGR